MTSTVELISDAAIQRNVEDEMIRSEIDIRHVAVRVANGRVLLTGRVPAPTDSSQAADIAWTTPGVIAVFNDLHTPE